jgi:hypothetical protein
MNRENKKLVKDCAEKYGDEIYDEYGDEEPDVEACDYTTVTYSEARSMWEAGEFSDWVNEHGGFPFDIGQEHFYSWDGTEGALLDDTWD